MPMRRLGPGTCFQTKRSFNEGLPEPGSGADQDQVLSRLWISLEFCFRGSCNNSFIEAHASVGSWFVCPSRGIELPSIHHQLRGWRFLDHAAIVLSVLRARS